MNATKPNIPAALILNSCSFENSIKLSYLPFQTYANNVYIGGLIYLLPFMSSSLLGCFLHANGDMSTLNDN